jgi:oligoendopeptidase F
MDTDEDVQDFTHDLQKAFIQHGGQLDEEVEKWMDSEFNRTFVTWMYPDLSNIQ